MSVVLDAGAGVGMGERPVKRLPSGSGMKSTGSASVTGAGKVSEVRPSSEEFTMASEAVRSPPPPPPPPQFVPSFSFHLTLPTSIRRPHHPAAETVASPGQPGSSPQMQSQGQTSVQAQIQPRGRSRMEAKVSVMFDNGERVSGSRIGAAGKEGLDSGSVQGFNAEGVAPPVAPLPAQSRVGTGHGIKNNVSTGIPPIPPTLSQDSHLPATPTSLFYPPIIPLVHLDHSASIDGEDAEMDAYHTSVSTHLRRQLTTQLSQYRRYSGHSNQQSQGGGATPASATQHQQPTVDPFSLSTAGHPARQQVDLAALAARDKEHSRAWVLEGYKRYTSALRPDEFMLDPTGPGGEGSLGKRRRRRYTDGEGLAVLDLGVPVKPCVQVVDGSAVILEEEEDDGDAGRAAGFENSARKRPRIGRSPMSSAASLSAAQALARRCFSADPDLCTSAEDVFARERDLAAHATISFADAVATMGAPTVLFPSGPGPMTHGSTPGLTSEGFTSIGGLVGIEAASFEGIQTPPPFAPAESGSGALGGKSAPDQSHHHTRTSYALSSDKLAITPVSPPRNRNKRPALFRGGKSSTSFATPARRASAHLCHAEAFSTGAGGSAIYAPVSTGQVTSSSSSLVSLTTASLSCSQADMSPRTPAPLLLSTLDSASMMDMDGSGVDAMHSPDEIDAMSSSSGGLSAENLARHNINVKCGVLETIAGLTQVGLDPAEGSYPRCVEGAEADFWAELSDLGTPL